MLDQVTRNQVTRIISLNSLRRIVDVLWPFGRLLVLVTVGVVCIVAVFEEYLIFHPRKYDGSDAWRPGRIDFEEVIFCSADGTGLHAWYFPHPDPRVHILHCHGNAGNITGRLGVARQLMNLGASVFLFDYRGYGRSEGKPTEHGVLADARAARGELARQAGIKESQIVLLGRSLGGAVAVDLAAKDGARGLILESTFTDLADVARVRFPFFPTRWLLRSRFDSIDKIVAYDGPLLQYHGTNDEIVPIELGRRLFAAASGVEGEQKEIFVKPGGGHNEQSPPEYYEVMGRFFDRLPGT